MEDDGPSGARHPGRPFRASGPCSGCSTRMAGAWATAKAFGWLVFIILILGYIPDRAYYLTVSRTVDLGVLAWSPINLCPPENKTLPVPGARRGRGPVGRVAEGARPARAAHRRGRGPGRDAILLHRRHRRHDRPVDGLRRQDGRDRQLRRVGRTVRRSPSRATDAAVAFVAGSIYVLGGKDADGAPTTTVFVLTPDGRPASSASGRRPTTSSCPSLARGPRPRRSRPRTGCC